MHPYPWLHDHTTCLQGYEAPGILTYYWQECEVVQSLWKNILAFSNKVIHATAIHILVFYPRETENLPLIIRNQVSFTELFRTGLLIRLNVYQQVNG